MCMTHITTYRNMFGLHLMVRQIDPFSINKRLFSIAILMYDPVEEFIIMLNFVRWF